MEKHFLEVSSQFIKLSMNYKVQNEIGWFVITRIFTIDWLELHNSSINFNENFIIDSHNVGLYTMRDLATPLVSSFLSYEAFNGDR